MPGTSYNAVHAVRLRAVVVAAWMSWLVPCAVMALVGFSEKGAALLPLSQHALVLIASVASVFAMAFGIAALLGLRREAGHAFEKRQALLGTGFGLALLLVVQTGSIGGALSRRDDEQRMRALSEAAVREYPGWNGNAAVGAARVFAVEIDRESGLGKVFLEHFDRAFVLVLVGVDNRVGDRDLVLDLDSARVHRSNGEVRKAVSRAEMRTRIVPEHEEAVAMHFAPYRIPVGSRLDNGLLLLMPEDSMRDVRGIEVSVDGAITVIPGRYFTIDDKRAIDATRARSPRGSQ